MNYWPADPDQDEVREQHKACPWPSLCLCTHVGCVSGWIDIRDDHGDRAIPCPNCRPEVAEHLRAGRGTLRRRREGLRDLRRPSRMSKDSPW